MSLFDDGDAGHDRMVERVDFGDECPHCHSSYGLTAVQDLTGAPLFVCGCGAQWTSYTQVTRPLEAA
jgi:hypothetical protein